MAEILAAAVATAVSGYLVAHFSGYFAAPAPSSRPPPAVQVVPNVGAGNASQVVQPAAPVPVDANQTRPASAQDGSTAPPARAVNATTPPPASSRKRAATDQGAVENKSHDADSVEARVRAALAKVDANRLALPATSPRPADIPPAPPAVAPAPAVGGSPSAVAVTPPHAPEIPPQPAQQAPVQADPLATVEIKSRPVAAVDASPAPLPAPPAEEDKGFFSAIKKIPELLRPDTPTPVGDAPRPPAPVGE